MPRSLAELTAGLGPEVDTTFQIQTHAYLTNAGVPSAVVPNFIGQFLFDTSNNAWYISYGVAAGNFVSVGEGSLSLAELAVLDGAIAGTAVASKAVVADANLNVAGLVLINNAPVACTAATLAVTAAAHANRTVVLDRAAGIAVTLPAAAGTGNKYRFIVKTTFTGAASIKSVTGADIMIGHALMGNNSDNSVVDWQAVASNTYDTIDLLGTSNSTGGMAGEEILIEDIAANVWFVTMRGDASGTEATPFADTVA